MLYFIYGKDTYRSKAKLKELIEKYQKDFEIEKIEAEKIKLDEFKNKLNSVSIFTQKRCLIFEDLSQSKEQKEIAEYLKNKKTEANDVLIFFENKVDKKTSLYRFLKKSAENLEFKEMKPWQIKKWAEEYIKQKKGSIEKVALEELLMGNNNLWNLSSELDKLLAFNKKITLANVKKLTSANFDDNIFNLADAVGKGDKTTALELIHKQLTAGTEAMYLLAMIIRQFRILIQIKEAKQTSSNYNQIAKNLELHPFVVQKTFSQADKYEFDDLKKIYNNLQEIDLRLKTSKISPEVLFTRFLFK